MYATLRFGVTLISIITVIGLFYPIIVFGLEILYNPYLLPISVKVQNYEEKQIAVVNITIIYRGSMPLTDFCVKILGKEYLIGSLFKGDNRTISFEVNLKDVKDIPKRVEVEFRIAKLYTFRIISEGEFIE